MVLPHLFPLQAIRQVLTLQQMAEFTGNWLSRNVLGYKNLPRYQPDLAKCVDHFIIHAGPYCARKCGDVGKGLGCQGRQGECF